MNCVKCGRAIENDQVFCPVCLEEMEQYPVKPGTVVHIPKHPEDDQEKKVTAKKKPVLSQEERIRRLRRKVLGLRIALAVVLLLCGLLSFGISKAVTELDFYRFLGQNYSTEETVATTDTPLSETATP